MPKALDLSGRIFGRLRVLGRSHRPTGQSWRWLCECTCGRHFTVQGSILKAGHTSACLSCATSLKNTTHGMARTPLYLRWRAMLERTGNPNKPEFHNYGGRGISVCERWLTSFENFHADMSDGFDPSLELDRIDVNGNYEPSNCRWATRKQQQLNRRNNHLVTWLDRTMTVQEWGELLGVKPNTIITRLRRGWDTDRAMRKGIDRRVLLELANQ